MSSQEPSGRASPPTERVVAVLDFLARHPHDRFGVSELSRRLGLSKPTCLGIVTTLTASDYLVREPRDKTYRLGPALISLGRTAQESLRVDPAARAELRRLSTITGTTAALSAVIDDRITVLELVGPAGGRRRCARRAELSVRPSGRADVRAVGRRRAARLAGQGADHPLAHRRRPTGPRRRRMPSHGIPRRAPHSGWSAPVRTDGRGVEQAARRIAGAARRVGRRHRRAGVPMRRERVRRTAPPPAFRYQRDLGAGVRPPSAPGDGGVAADRPGP